jgi:hypothetical protein
MGGIVALLLMVAGVVGASPIRPLEDSQGTVVDFVAVAPPSFTAFQQNSTGCLQLTQQQSLGITAGAIDFVKIVM